MEFRRISWFSTILFLLLIFLQYRIWFEPGGIQDMLRLKKQLAIEQLQNDKLKKRNQTVMLQIQGLQKNGDAIEARARQELGMIKKDETFYQVTSIGKAD